jgi:excinuclease ABC subunit C
MAIRDLKARIDRLPMQPGVYVFLGTDGETLYVGKARVLRDRVRSYLGKTGEGPRLDALLRDAVALDAIVTDSVVEALALENRLIKQRYPRYNVLLRDDKTYPYLQLTTAEPAPRLLVARRVEKDGNVYAGPFMPAAVARRTMSLAHRLFGIRSCNEVIDGRRDRPCLEYDIKRCLAPCVASLCTLEQYGRAVAQARLLIEGRQAELVTELRQEMAGASSEERFERAAQLRDAIRTVETLRDRENKLETPSADSRDAFGVKTGARGGVVEVFQIRRGRVMDRAELVTERPPQVNGEAPESSETAAVLTAAIQQFYAEREPPPLIHVPVDPGEERDVLETWLSSRAGRRVRIAVPQRGEARGLLELAVRNAGVAYQVHFGDAASSAAEGVETLGAALALAVRPRWIECFDISTLAGRETVASMVVAIDGQLRRSEYRKFKIRDARLDDFASMHEVVLRRYRRLLEHGGPFPDLILVDGGKGQLTAAYAALREIGLDRLVIAALAKEEELLFTRDREDGLKLPPESPALRLVQRLRDEAHRVAVTFHRQSRGRRDLRSELDDVQGIGPRRRKQLLTTFGSLAGVRRASRADLAAAVGAKAADAVIRHFSST